jgi:ligand-binding sensor domain-containing protein
MQNGEFSHYSRSNGLAADYCLGPMFEDGQETLWVATISGLQQFSNGVFKTLSAKIVRGICQDLSSNIWLASGTGIECWSNGVALPHLPDPFGLYVQNVRTICCGPDGTIWAGAADEVYRIKNGALTRYLKGQGPKYNLVSAIFIDRRGTFWVGTYSGLFRVVDGEYVPELSAGGLPYGTVTEIFEDREGDLWVCAKEGLVRLKPNRVLCYTEQQGLGNDNVSSVLQDRNGNICAGTWGAGLSVLRDGVFTTYSTRGPSPNLVLGQHQDRAGHLWVGTDFNQGLFELERDRVRRFTERPGGAELPAVRVIYEDHASDKWVGTSEGLFKLHNNKLETSGNKNLNSELIRAITEDHAGNLWIGTKHGLVRKQGNSYTWYTATNGLRHDYVLTIFEDRRHTLWLGTLGGGLVRCHDGGFTSYTTADGLFANNIGSILEDDRGWLWLGSDRGIFRVSLEELADFDNGAISSLRSISYGKTDGMANKICNRVAQPAAIRSRDGRLWFATIKGVCVIDPNLKVLPEGPVPPVVIEEIHTERDHLFNVQAFTRPVRLQPGVGELEFHYAALAYRAPEENRYKYKLDSVDTDWVEANHRQIAHYNNIYPGRYTFHVLACNSDGVWNRTGTSVSVILLPHFWQTLWFKPAWMSAAALGLFILYRVILNRRLEINRLRLRIAADLHDEIGSNLASISLLSQLGQKSQANGASAEFSEINRIALFTANGIREIVWFINPEYDTTTEVVARMKEIAAQMLVGMTYRFDSPAGQSARKLSPEFRRNFFLIFKEIMHNIVKHAQAGNVEISMYEAHGMLHLRVVDDGKGFDPAAVSRGNGLRNIRLRTGNLGGTVAIARGPKGGAVVEVAVRIT